MSSILPININDLLTTRVVESARVEFKKSWNEVVSYQVLRTICAFANDMQNLNGGYVVIGVAENSGVANLPPDGLDASSLDSIQRNIRGICKRLQPDYCPIISPETVDGRHIIVIWAPASDIRPHSAPESESGQRDYYVRQGSESVKAKGEILTSLLSMTAKIPFDDRRALNVPIEKLLHVRVREFLNEVKSALLNEQDAAEIYRKMRISKRVNGHEAPTNCGLLFFSDDPEEFFPGARIEVVQFSGGPSANIIEERVFRGPLHYQLRSCISYLHNFTVQHLEKLADRPEVKGWVSYPIPAIEEAIVNAVYHRNYENNSEPVKVYMYPAHMEIISYPGPVPGIRKEHLAPHGRIPPVPSRNRRIGEFLKELRLAEGRGTGIPKVYKAMENNNSPEPSFDFDEERTYFRVTLPAHPEYAAILALRDAAHFRAVGDFGGAIERLKKAHGNFPNSETITVELIDALAAQERLDEALKICDNFCNAVPQYRTVRVLSTTSNAFINAKRFSDAAKLLNRLPVSLPSQEAIDAAILERRAKRLDKAHRYFMSAGDAVYNDVKALHEFAQTKAQLANELRRNKSRKTPYDMEAIRTLRKEAHDMLRRVLQMDAPPLRHANAWLELGWILYHNNAPVGDIIAAFERAVELAPDNELFVRELKQKRKELLGS